MKTKETLNFKSLRGKRFLTVLISFILINLSTSFSEVLSAEKNKDEIDNTSQIKMELIINEEPEEELKLESWMIEEFKALLTSQKDLNCDEVVEEELEIEPWMSDFETSNYITNLCAPAIEEELEIEDWMISINFDEEKDNLGQDIVLK